LKYNPDIRKIIKFLLIGELYEVKSCPNTKAFGFQMNLLLPDMAILHIMLPDGNGLEICNQLKGKLMMSANNHLSAVKAKCDAQDLSMNHST